MLEPGERGLRAQHDPPAAPQHDAHPAREVVLGAQHGAPLGRHGHGQHVRRAGRLALEQHRPARRAPAQPPLAAAGLGAHERARRARSARPCPPARTTIALAASGPAEPAARERGHRAVAEPGLAPPPLARERAAPVLLDVGVPAVERRRSRRRAPPRRARARRARPGASTAAAPARPARRRARRAPARGHPPRPSSTASRRASGPRSTAIRRSEPRSTGAPSALPRGRAEPARLGGRRGRVAPAHEPARVRGERDDRPRPVARAADAAQRDDAAPRRRVAQPPVVALHRDAVRAPRIAEGKVGPGPAVGVEDPAHTAGGRLTSYGSQSRFQNASRPCSRMYASSLRWIGYMPWMLTGSASPTSMPV